MRKLLRRNRLMLLALALVVGFGVTVALVSRPADPTEDGPGGLGALVRLLELRDVQVVRSPEPAPGDVFFLRDDLRDPDQAGRVLAWVREGGRLVVADPGSETLAAAGLSPSEPVGGLAVSRELRADCADPSVVGVGTIVSAPWDAAWEPAAGAVGCFGAGDGAFLARVRLGTGDVIAVGGVTPFTNEHLRAADDAVLAWNVFGSDSGRVVLGPPAPPGERAPTGVWSVLPRGARAVILQLGLATLLFALARGRRLGSPVEDPFPSPIPATDLVRATGELYRRARAASHSVTLVQEGFRSRVRARLGLPAEATDAAVAGAAAAAAGVAHEEVGEALRPRPGADERTLVRVARDLERVAHRIEGGDVR